MPYDGRLIVTRLECTHGRKCPAKFLSQLCDHSEGEVLNDIVYLLGLTTSVGVTQADSVVT